MSKIKNIPFGARKLHYFKLYKVYNASPCSQLTERSVFTPNLKSFFRTRPIALFDQWANADCLPT